MAVRTKIEGHPDDPDLAKAAARATADMVRLGKATRHAAHARAQADEVAGQTFEELRKNHFAQTVGAALLLRRKEQGGK